MVALALLIAGAPPPATASSPTLSRADSRRAHASRARSVRDSAHLHLVSADGNTLVERGSAVGDLPGPVEVRLTLGERTASSRFTIRTSGGAIGGHGQGTLKPGKGGYESFGGSVTVVGGTGRFRGAHGKGSLYGSIYRVNDSLSLQVVGRLYY